MPEFCTCGSIIFNNQCSNKNCSNKSTSKSASSKQSSAKDPTAKKEAKGTRTRRSSKCITYNLYDEKKDDGEE